MFRHRINVRDVFIRGKRNRMREQGLINYEKRQQNSDASGGRPGVLDPEDSAMTEIENAVATRLSVS